MVKRSLTRRRERQFQPGSKPSKPAAESEQRPEVLFFEEGVQRVADRVLELLRKKPLVTALLYGLPNVGKSELVDAIMRRIARGAAGKLIYGGEVKGYDERPDRLYEDLPAVYFIDRLTYSVGDRTEKILVTTETEENGFPHPDFAIVIINPEMYNVDPNNFIGHADVIINNLASHKKDY